LGYFLPFAMEHLLAHYRAHLEVSTKPGLVLVAAIHYGVVHYFHVIYGTRQVSIQQE